MLNGVDLNVKVSKKEYKSVIKSLESELTMLEQEMNKERIPMIILFEGWGASGKGRAISKLINTIDPRHYKVFATTQATESQTRYPWLRRFWLTTPAEGLSSIFDRSWYYSMNLDYYVNGIGEEEVSRRCEEINDFEQDLFERGTLIIKFFMHISQKEQKKRLKALLADDTKSWRVSKSDIEQNKHYDEHKKSLEYVFSHTHHPHAQWNILESHDYYYMVVKMYNIIINLMSQAIKLKKAQNTAEKVYGLPKTTPYINPNIELKNVTSLDECDLSKTILKDDYKKELMYYQQRLKTLHSKLYLNRIPLIIAYEGWDAAGKGGNIKRVAQALDPQGFQVNPSSAPNDFEKAHHFLWRYWRDIPMSGHIGIFDRTWYGRVMVEPIEKFCTLTECARAYNDIVEFEYQLHRFGAIIKKFWLHIDKDEQLKRFYDRESMLDKQWKITDDDWRNREKWDDYYTAVNKMIKYTSTDFAPWEIIESNDKRYARIKALRSIIKSIEMAVE